MKERGLLECKGHVPQAHLLRGVGTIHPHERHPPPLPGALPPATACTRGCCGLVFCVLCLAACGGVLVGEQLGSQGIHHVPAQQQHRQGMFVQWPRACWVAMGFPSLASFRVLQAGLAEFAEWHICVVLLLLMRHAAKDVQH